MAEAGKNGTNNRRVKRNAHWIEWVVGGICTLLVSALTLWIAYHAVVDAGGTPQLGIEITQTKTNADGTHMVAFVIRNTGTQTAAAVPVIGALKDGDKVIETREITFDYVPAQSSATGTILFKADPASYRLEIGASGYADP